MQSLSGNSLIVLCVTYMSPISYIPAYHCTPHQRPLHGDSSPLPTHGECSWPATPLLICSPHRPTMSHHWSVQTDSMEQHEMLQRILAGDRQWPPLGCQNCHHRQTQMLHCSTLQVSLHLELLHPLNVQHHLL